MAFETPASAYLDPGAGSMLLQALLGGVAAAGVIARPLLAPRHDRNPRQAAAGQTLGCRRLYEAATVRFRRRGPGEMRLATWDKIDTAGRVWVSPATRAGEILEAARTLGTAFQRLQRLVSSTASLSNAVPTATRA